jgi:hypothetical protein
MAHNAATAAANRAFAEQIIIAIVFADPSRPGVGWYPSPEMQTWRGSATSMIANMTIRCAAQKTPAQFAEAVAEFLRKPYLSHVSETGGEDGGEPAVAAEYAQPSDGLTWHDLHRLLGMCAAHADSAAPRPAP